MHTDILYVLKRKKYLVFLKCRQSRNVKQISDSLDCVTHKNLCSSKSNHVHVLYQCDLCFKV